VPRIFSALFDTIELSRISPAGIALASTKGCCRPIASLSSRRLGLRELFQKTTKPEIFQSKTSPAANHVFRAIGAIRRLAVPARRDDDTPLRVSRRCKRFHEDPIYATSSRLSTRLRRSSAITHSTSCSHKGGDTILGVSHRWRCRMAKTRRRSCRRVGRVFAMRLYIADASLIPSCWAYPSLTISRSVRVARNHYRPFTKQARGSKAEDGSCYA